MKKIIPLIGKYSVLMNIRLLVSDQRSKLAERIKRKMNEYDLDLFFIIDDKSSAEYSLLQLLEEDSTLFFKVSNVVIQTTSKNEMLDQSALVSFKHKEKIDGKTLEFKIKLYLSKKLKCERCYEYKAEKEGEFCKDCQDYLNKENSKTDITKNLLESS